MTTCTIAGLPNILAAPVVSITTPAPAAGGDMPISNVKDMNNPSLLGRVDSIFPHESYVEIDFGPTPAEKIRQVGLGRHTLVPGDQLRIIGVQSGSLPPARSETLAPDAIVDYANVISSPPNVANIDEHPSTPDGTVVAQSSLAAPMYVQVSFPTPSASPAAGPNLQCFLVWASSTVQVDPGGNTILSAALYEDGVLRKELGEKAITPPEPGDPTPVGNVFIFPWSASDLQTADGSDVELRVTFAAGGEGNGLLDAVSWEVMHQTDVDAADTDTGWQTIEGQELEPDFGNTAIDEVDAPPALWVANLPSDTTVAKARIEFRADGVGYFNSFLQTPPREPATFIDAGFAIINFAYEFPYNFMDGGELRPEFKMVGEDEPAVDGSTHTVVQYSWRQAELDFRNIPKSHADALLRRLYAAGSAQAFVVTLDPDDVNGFGTFLAVAQQIGGHRYSNMSRANREGVMESTTRDFQLQLSEHLG